MIRIFWSTFYLKLLGLVALLTIILVLFRGGMVREKSLENDFFPGKVKVREF